MVLYKLTGKKIESCHFNMLRSVLEKFSMFHAYSVFLQGLPIGNDQDNNTNQQTKTVKNYAYE